MAIYIYYTDIWPYSSIVRTRVHTGTSSTAIAILACNRYNTGSMLPNRVHVSMGVYTCTLECRYNIEIIAIWP